LEGKGDSMNDMTLQHITLRDDGTLDTVVECECPLCNEEITYRFSQETRFIYGGDITLMAQEAWEEEICGIDH
jgi:hypothetical protein